MRRPTARSRRTGRKTLELNAPRTDVPNTYAEWQLFVPPSLRLSNFGGSMNIAQGTTYELLDAWEKFLAFLRPGLARSGRGDSGHRVSGVSRHRAGDFRGAARLERRHHPAGGRGDSRRAGRHAVARAVRAKRKAQRINSVNNLKQIGLAAQIFSGDNGDRLPISFDEMKNELGTDKITYDTETGQRYTYLGGGMSLDSLKPDSVLAYSPIVNGHCEVLFADGSVEQMTAGKFAELSQRGLVQLATPQEIAAEQQRQAIARGQLVAGTPPVATAVPADGSGGRCQAIRRRQVVVAARDGTRRRLRPVFQPLLRRAWPTLPASVRFASNCRRPASRSCSRKFSTSATSRFPSAPAS